MFDEFADIPRKLQLACPKYRFDRGLAVWSRFLVRDELLLQNIWVDIIADHFMALHVDGKGARQSEFSQPEETNLHGCTFQVGCIPGCTSRSNRGPSPTLG